jgi:hypothetical protein
MECFVLLTGAAATAASSMSDDQLVNEMSELGRILDKMGPDDVAKLLASDPNAAEGDAPSPGISISYHHIISYDDSLIQCNDCVI